MLGTQGNPIDENVQKSIPCQNWTKGFEAPLKLLGQLNPKPTNMNPTNPTLTYSTWPLLRDSVKRTQLEICLNLSPKK